MAHPQADQPSATSNPMYRYKLTYHYPGSICVLAALQARGTRPPSHVLHASPSSLHSSHLVTITTTRPLAPRDAALFISPSSQVSSNAWNCGINWLTRDAFFNSYFGGFGCYHVVVHAPQHYEACDSLGDAYVEAQRMTACRRDCISPLDFWGSDAGFKSVIAAALALPKGDVCTWALREAIYSRVKECTNFKPSLAKHIIEFFGAKKVLDFSAGWGERMLGAMAAEVEEYLAFDPNLTLQAGHSLALRTHGTPQQQQNFHIRYEPFESSNLSPEDFSADLVFTSPPFFNLEVYTTQEHAKGQSIQSHKGVNAWLVKFLFQALKKAWSCLSRGGHMALHYSDTTKERTVRHPNTCPKDEDFSVMIFSGGGHAVVLLGLAAALQLRRRHWQPRRLRHSQARVVPAQDGRGRRHSSGPCV
jgi:hypothetical protein